jgi:Tfp pilus assembly protein PilO
MEEAPKKEAWHLDRKVPVAIILMMLCQCLAMVWYVATTKANLEYVQGDHQRRIVAMETTSTRYAAEAQRVSEQIARMDERLIAQTTILRRIEDSLSPRPAPQPRQ